MTDRTHSMSLISATRPHITGDRAESEQQHMLLLGNPCELSPFLVAVCQALEIVLVPLRGAYELPMRLHQLQPIAVIAADLRGEAACCAILRTIAAHDQDLPVLLVAEDAPVVQGAVDVAEQLWGLTAVSLFSPAQDAQDVVGFLFQATRWRDTGRFLPVA